MSIQIISQPAADWLAQALSNEQLYHLLRAVPPLAAELLRGHKMTAASMGRKIVRRRIAAELARREDFLALFLEAQDAPWSDWQLAFECLDPAYVRFDWRKIARAAGPSFIVALATAAEEDLQKRARRTLRTTAIWQASSTTEAHCDAMVSVPSPLAAMHAALSQVAGTLRMPDNQEQKNVDKAQRQAAAAEKEIEKLTAALAKQRGRTKDAEQKAAALEEQSGSRQKTLQQELRVVRQKYTELESRFEDELQNRIDNFKREQLGVSPELKRIQCELESNATAPLHERVQEVLHAHAALNEKYGTISQIKAQIAELHTAQEEITRCLMQSVRILPALHEVHKAVNEKIEELEARLPNWQKPSLSEPVQRLLQKIGAATLDQDGLAALTGLERQLTSGLVHDLLAEDEMATLKAALVQQRRQLEELAFEQEMQWQSPPAPRPFPPQHKPEVIWNIKQTLQRTGASVVVYVDGYNAMLRTAHYRSLEIQKGLDTARRIFCQRCQEKTAFFEHVEVVFDGRGALSERETTKGLTVVFSANLEESQNADNYIVERMHAEQSPDHQLWLVTDDGGLKRRVLKITAGFVTPQDFIAFLHDNDA